MHTTSQPYPCTSLEVTKELTSQLNEAYKRSVRNIKGKKKGEISEAFQKRMEFLLERYEEGSFIAWPTFQGLLNEAMGIILEGNPSIKKSERLLISCSAVPNAFCLGHYPLKSRMGI